MKKRTTTYFGMVLLSLLTGAQLFAQTIVNMPFNTGVFNTFTTTAGACSFTFRDNGATANYSNSSNPALSIVTFAPSNSATSRVIANFTQFQTENTFDALYIYRGTVAETNAAGPNASITAGNLLQNNQFNSGAAVGNTFRAGGYQAAGALNQSFVSTAASGALTFQFDSDLSVVQAGWTAEIFEIPICSITAPANISTSTGTANCVANVVTPLPAISCTGVSLNYSVGAGAPVAVPAPFPATVTIPNLPSGTFTITWRITVTNPCNTAQQITIGTATQTITVADLVPPVITCPQDIIVTLDPGACAAFINYNVTVTDNCPLTGPSGSVTTSPPLVNNNTNSPGGTVFFDLVNPTTLPLTITSLSNRQSGASVVNVYTKTGTGFGFEQTQAAWTLVSSGNATGSLIPFAVNFQIQPGVTGVCLHVVTAQSQYTNGTPAVVAPYGTSTNGTFTDGVLTVRAGATSNTFFASAPFNPRIWNGAVTYMTPSAGDIVQTQGLPSGSAFPVGTTVNCFETEDVAGNPASCCFDVTVNGFPNATTTLVCNDLVQISLDEDCELCIGADAILEGGPYRCYDEYVVMVLNQLGGFPVFSGTAPCIVDERFIGPEWTVKVTDPQTGNSCWGKIIVEDKIPPTISCIDLSVPCTADLDEVADQGPNPGLSGPQSKILTGLNNPLGETGAPVPDVQLYSFDFNNIPDGCPVLDVNARIRLTGHNFLPDLDIVVIAPDGTAIDIFSVTGCTGQDWPIDCTFDDEGATITLCAQINAAGGAVRPFCAPGVSCSVLAGFDGKNGHGIWQVRITDADASDDGIVETVGLIINVSCPEVLPGDNCGTPVLSFEDDFTDGNCGGPSGTVIRTWTATDAVGNHTSCNQTITFDRPSLADVVIPQDIKWTCDQYNAYPNIIEATELHEYITDSDPTTEVIDVNLDPDCDDADFTSANGNQSQDWPFINSTNKINNPGQPAAYVGCPGAVVSNINNPNINSGLDDADVLELTGSGLPTIDGKELVDICGIGVEYEDIWVPVCPGTFKIIRQWTLIDWCANPVAVQQLNQVIKVVDEEAPSIDVIVQDTFHQVYTLGQPAPIFCNNQNITISALTLNSNPNQLPCANTHYEIGDTLEVVYNPPTSQNVVSWTIIEDVIHVLCPTPPIGQPGSAICQVKLKLRKYTFSSQATIDIYDASAPTPNGPHGICEGTVVVNQYNNPLLRIFVDEDNCSGIATKTASLWGPGPNGVLNGPGVADDELLGTVDNHEGPFFNVPLFFNGAPAMYNIVFKVTDGCGNQNSATLKVTLRDKVPPVAVCDEITEISVTNNGLQPGQSCSTLHAENLDDGSYDNCKPVYFLAAKMAAAPSAGQSIFNRCYYPTLDFCCAEVGTTQTVILLVLDGNPAPLFTSQNVPSSGCNGTPGLFLGSSFSALNFNTCMVQVEVTDKLPPILVNCPAQQRITCDWYSQNLEATLFGIENNSALTAAQKDAQQDAFLTPFFGQPTFYDNCALVITPQVTLNIDQCLEGRIIRTWTARDNAGNNAQQSCVQTIFVDHVSDFVVQFPADATINCGTATPDFGEPKIFFETCELVAVSHEDQLFTVVADACFKLLRTWTVINWCVVGAEIDQEVVESSELQFQQAFPSEPCDFDGELGCNNRTFRDSWRVSPKAKPGASNATNQTGPDTDPDTDPWDGYITYQQVIKVQDTVDPVFTNGCAIPDVCINDNSCVATVILPTPQITECSPTVTITVQIQIGGNWIAQGVNGFGPYFNVAPGTYPVRYTAIDNCNNQTVCNSSVKVKDCKLPTPYCKAGIVVELMVVDPPMVVVWAVDLNDNSFDNCPGALKFSFSPNVNDTGKTYDCDDFGPNEDTLYVTDAAGNQDFCTTIVNIQANQGQCNDDPQVAGTVATAGSQKVEGVSVSINSPNGFTESTTTDVQGAYNFGSVPSLQDYTITPVLDVEPLNGVSTFDLVLISKHILGVQALDSPYKLIAADANKSNTVTTFDLVEIRKLILFINTDFPNNTSWRFVPKTHTFANPSNPFQVQFPEVINLNDLTLDKLNNDFVAIKVGDVNGSAAVNFGASNQDRNYNGDLVLNVEDAEVKAGETVTVEFKATDFNVSGYQFTLAFNQEALEFAGVEAGLATEGNFGLTMVNQGIITTSWNAETAKQLAAGEVVFGLSFTAKQSGKLSQLMSINSRYTAAEAYNASSELMNVALSFNGQLSADGFALYQNTPNPFASETVIGFYLPEATSATLSISDVQGKVVKVIAPASYNKGYNQVSVKRSELGATGVLYYRLDAGADSATRMMILVD